MSLDAYVRRTISRHMKVLAVVLAVTLLTAPNDSPAQQPQAPLTSTFAAARKAGKSRIDTALLAIAANQRVVGMEELLMRDAAGRVLVRVTAKDVGALEPKLRNIGFVTVASHPNLHFVEGYLPLGAVNGVENFAKDGLMGVLAGLRPQVNPGAGSVVSQAVFVHEADRVRTTLPIGYDGSGVKIGVLSDSYDNLGGAAAGVSSGNLPAGVTVLSDIGSGGTDEGRAMLELVYDVAPGSTLAFATAFISEASFASNIVALKDAGCNVIVDDVVYYAEPFFQDGVVAQAVDTVYAAGVPYFSSANNQASRAYESTTWTEGNTPPTVAGFSSQWYDFDPGAGVDTRQSVTLTNGQTIRLSFQWDDPYYTVAGVDTDLDLYLVDTGTATIRAVSDADNLANQTPFEFINFTNSTGSTRTYDVMIHRFVGPAPGRIKYINFGSQITINQFNTNSPTVNPHGGAAGGMAVAAAPYYDHLNPESFTSTGPRTLLFNADGSPKGSPEVRQKPEICAVDGTDTSFFGSDADGNSLPNFFGTSAAAPHAAAVAALIKHANPLFTPAQIYSRIRTTADPSIGGPGFDNLTGDGLINAYTAVFGPPVSASIPFSDGFETGVLSLAWEVRTNVDGRVLVNGIGGPATGAKHMTLDTYVNSSLFSRNEAILHVNAAGLSNVTLTFKQREFSDEDNVMPASFSGSVDADGVAFSVDGSNWFSVISLTGAASAEFYQTQTFNLSSLAALNSLVLGTDVRIKFQQYDNVPINPPTPSASDGFAFDDVQITIPPPMITVGPQSTAGCVTGSANFTVTATSDGPPTYQWRRGVTNLSDGINIFGSTVAGALTSSLTISNIHSGDAGTDYNCVVSNAGGSTPSSDATLTVNLPPTVDSGPSPSSQTKCVGENATITISASGAGSLTYQWRRGVTNLIDGPHAGLATISGATTNSLTLTGVQTGDAATDYNCVVTGLCSPAATSGPATLSVNSAPSITGGPTPASQTKCAGESASIAITASGAGPLSYQWYKGATALTNAGNISGADTDTLTIDPVSAGDAANNYHCVVSGTCSPTAMTGDATLIVWTIPSVTLDPIGGTVGVGAFFQFTVAATGGGLHYQWYHGVTPVGTDSANYTIPSVTAGDAGSYRCMVSNTCGSDTSGSATLGVNSEATLTLTVSPGCHTGSKLVVAISMTGATTTVVGGQYFLEYNPSVLQLVSADPGDAPFTRQIHECSTVAVPPMDCVPTAGQIDYASGIEDGGTGTSANTIMASFSFTVIDDVCALTPNLVWWRASGPNGAENRLSDANADPVTANVVNLGAIKIDTTDPELHNVPAGGDLGCNPTTMPSCDGAVTATDNCDGDVTASVTCTPGSITSVGTCGKSQSFTYSAVDTCGNPVSQIVTYTWREDTTPPELHNVPDGGNLGCNPTTMPSCDGAVTATDNCDGTLSVTCTPGAITGGPCSRSQSFTYSAVDTCGNPVSQNVNYTWREDTTPPELNNLPASGYQGCNPTTMPSCDGAVTATDNCDGTLSVTCTPGSITSVGTCGKSQSFNYSAVDTCGNPVSQNVNYTWREDTTPPELQNVPAGGDLGCNPTTMPSCDGAVTATDNCDGTVIVTCTPGPLSGGPCSRSRSFTYSAVDTCGNPVSQNVTYTWREDTTAPTISCPADIEVNADSSCTATVSVGTPTVGDNCAPAPTFEGVRIDSQPLNAPYPLGDTTITWTATDACGNSAECVQTVTVNGASVVSNLVVDLQGNHAPVARCIRFVPSPGGCTAGSIYRTLNFIDHDGDDVNLNGIVDSTEGGSNSPSTPVRAIVPSVDNPAALVLPCGVYTHLCAKDEQHTLWATTTLTPAGSMYNAGPPLLLKGGDTDNDGDVDINDVTYFIFRFGTIASVGGCPWNSARDADFGNNGLVFGEDYNFLFGNWLGFSSCPCSLPALGGKAGALPGPGPAFVDAVALSTSELRTDVAAAVDLNCDGKFDYRDVERFEQLHGFSARLSSKLRSGRVPVGADLSPD